MSLQLEMFSIHDSAAKAYLTPFFCPTTAVAIRNFKAAANEEGHQFNRHAGDYTLFLLGIFEADTGKVLPSKTATPLGRAIDYIENDIPELPRALMEAPAVQGGE